MSSYSHLVAEVLDKDLNGRRSVPEAANHDVASSPIWTSRNLQQWLLRDLKVLELPRNRESNSNAGTTTGTAKPIAIVPGDQTILQVPYGRRRSSFGKHYTDDTQILGYVKALEQAQGDLPTKVLGRVGRAGRAEKKILKANANLCTNDLPRFLPRARQVPVVSGRSSSPVQVSRNLATGPGGRTIREPAVTPVRSRPIKQSSRNVTPVRVAGDDNVHSVASDATKTTKTNIATPSRSVFKRGGGSSQSATPVRGRDNDDDTEIVSNLQNSVATSQVVLSILQDIHELRNKVLPSDESAKLVKKMKQLDDYSVYSEERRELKCKTMEDFRWSSKNASSTSISQTSSDGGNSNTATPATDADEKESTSSSRTPNNTVLAQPIEFETRTFLNPVPRYAHSHSPPRYDERSLVNKNDRSRSRSPGSIPNSPRHRSSSPTLQSIKEFDAYYYKQFANFSPAKRVHFVSLYNQSFKDDNRIFVGDDVVGSSSSSYTGIVDEKSVTTLTTLSTHQDSIPVPQSNDVASVYPEDLEEFREKLQGMIEAAEMVSDGLGRRETGELPTADIALFYECYSKYF